MKDIKHLIGNPVFAIETNLECLRSRIGQMDSEDLRGPSQVASEAYEICDAIQQSLETIKDVLHETC